MGGSRPLLAVRLCRLIERDPAHEWRPRGPLSSVVGRAPGLGARPRRLAETGAARHGRRPMHPARPHFSPRKGASPARPTRRPWPRCGAYRRDTSPAAQPACRWRRPAGSRSPTPPRYRSTASCHRPKLTRHWRASNGPRYSRAGCPAPGDNGPGPDRSDPNGPGGLAMSQWAPAESG